MRIDDKTGILYRDGTFDAFILNESRNYFKNDLQLSATDRCLDLGGHIGCFAARAMLECPGLTLASLEAEKSNAEVLQLNAAKFGFGQVYGAIVPDHLNETEIPIYVNVKKNNALHSTVPVRGRETQMVLGMGFSMIFDAFKPTFVKIDVEGAEYDLPWEKLPSSVTRLVMELHLTHRGHREAARLLVEKLKTVCGFTAVIEPKLDPAGKNWTTMSSWRR